jgi:hypothetical protein
VFGLLADIYGSFSAGMLIYGIVASVATLTLLPIKPRFWTSPAERDRPEAAAPGTAVPAR